MAAAHHLAPEVQGPMGFATGSSQHTVGSPLCAPFGRCTLAQHGKAVPLHPPQNEQRAPNRGFHVSVKLTREQFDEVIGLLKELGGKASDKSDSSDDTTNDSALCFQ